MYFHNNIKKKLKNKHTWAQIIMGLAVSLKNRKLQNF